MLRGEMDSVFGTVRDTSTILSCKTISSGQTATQVDASSGQLNLRTDLRWLAKRTHKFTRKYTQVVVAISAI